MSSRLPVIAIAALALLVASSFVFHPFAATRISQDGTASSPAPPAAVSRREYLARLVAETAARTAAETARAHAHPLPAPLPDVTRIARGDTP